MVLSPTPGWIDATPCGTLQRATVAVLRLDATAAGRLTIPDRTMRLAVTSHSAIHRGTPMRHALRTAIGLSCLLSASLAASDIERLRLESPDAVLEVTPWLGGRGLHFGIPGLPNLIKVGDAVQSHPHPVVSADADDIGHLGHDVWLGPQSGWWSDQSANPARRDARAAWPPDPYLAFAQTTVLEHTSDKLVLEGIDSPVTGVRLTKTFAFDANDPATVNVGVEARNLRDTPVSRDLWFNTRASAAMRVYVPVDGESDVRMETSAEVAAPVWRIEDGLFSFMDAPLPAGREVRRGKAFLQPSSGWMAGFAHGQAFVIRFALEPRESIHPEHGQVELYLDHGPDIADGLLELEVHAPYRTLAPGETMAAAERWTVLRYDGPDDQASHADFLCERLALCVEAAGD